MTKNKVYYPHKNKIDITIVVDMLLTGFDSKWINTLYMDKEGNYTLDEMPREFVYTALTMYQNKDGGWGHGLDNDNLNPNSNVSFSL